MPAPSLRFEAPTFEPLFVESLTSYITLKCREYRVRREDVFDVVQEALTTIYASVRMFRPEKGDFDTWARGVARNVIRRHLRRAKRHGARFSAYPSNVDDYVTHAPSPERCVQRKQAHSSISNALKTLTAQQASVVVLFDIDDLSHKEIGNDLDITEAASHTCHKRAHKRLAKCLDRELLSVMPPALTGCDEPASFNEQPSRQCENSHYNWQSAKTILALLLSLLRFSSTATLESTTGNARVLAPVQNAVTYRSDEPTVHLDAPSVKPEPASLTSVRDVSTPTRAVDKRTPRHDLAPLPPYKHTPDALDHRLPDR
jgi:RNA polymerase sigma factor (sigma-70 family)